METKRVSWRALLPSVTYTREAIATGVHASPKLNKGRINGRAEFGGRTSSSNTRNIRIPPAEEWSIFEAKCAEHPRAFCPASLMSL